MATTDLHFVSGALHPTRRGIRFLGGAVDDGLQIDAAAAAMKTLNYTSGAISAWVMVPDIAGTYAVIGFGDANAVDYIYMDIVAGKLHAKCARAGPNVAWDIVASTKSLVPHKWHHVCLVQDVQTPKLYLDGEELALTLTDVTEPTFWFDDVANIDGGHIGAADSIAGDAALTLEFKGYISKVKIWGGATTVGALTAAEVKQDFLGATVNSSNLHNSWDLEDDLLDDGSGNDTATVVGDLIFSDANEFSSRLTFLETVPLTADNISIMADKGVGYAYSVLAA
jgi:hypothetical protein